MDQSQAQESHNEFSSDDELGLNSDSQSTHSTDQNMSINNFSNNNQNTIPSNKSKTKPIILSSVQWRKSVPSILNISDISLDNIFAKAAAGGNIWLRTDSVESYCKIQKCLYDQNISFHSFNLSQDQSLKIVIRGLPTDITEDEIRDDLENCGYTVKLVKRFGSRQNKLIPICLIILTKNTTATDIFNLFHMFYINV